MVALCFESRRGQSKVSLAFELEDNEDVERLAERRHEDLSPLQVEYRDGFSTLQNARWSDCLVAIGKRNISTTGGHEQQAWCL